MEFQAVEHMMLESGMLEKTDLADLAKVVEVGAAGPLDAVLLLGHVHHVGVAVGVRDLGAGGAGDLLGPPPGLVFY